MYKFSIFSFAEPSNSFSQIDMAVANDPSGSAKYDNTRLGVTVWDFLWLLLELIANLN